MGLFDSVFFPKKKKNIFNIRRYLNDLNSGLFRDKFNLGIQALNGGSWRLKDFTKEPNAVFGGSMGSGKSKATVFTINTWMYANSDKTILFITDSLKGAEDYRSLFDYEQVYTGFDEEKIHKIVDLLFDEIKSRKKLFAEVKAESITQYDKKVTKFNRDNPKNQKPKEMARVVMVMEEFHAVPHQIMNFSAEFKKEMTTASKFHQIMRVGRSYGVWVLACSQKMTASDIPTEIVPNLTQKQVFKVSRGESNYFLGNDSAAKLTTDQKGRCVTEEGFVQFPLLPDPTQKKLLQKYMKPLTAGCAYLNDQLIKDYLAGKSTEELYKYKPLTELVTGIKNFDDKVVVQMLHKKMGHEVEDPALEDSFGLTMIVNWPGDTEGVSRKVAVMNRIGVKVTSKNLDRLARAMEKYRCTNGIIYTSEINMPKSLYNEANEAHIEIVDHEDFINLAKKIEHSQESTPVFDPEQLAADDKESGDYQEKNKDKIKEYREAQAEMDKLADERNKIKEDAERKAKELVKQMDLYPDIDDEELKDAEFDFPEDMEEVPEWLEADDPYDFPEDFDDLDSEEKVIDEEDMEETPDQLEVSDENNDGSVDEFADILMGERAKTKHLKRIPVRSQFNLRAEETPSLMFHLLKNIKGEVYRCLFLVMVDGQIKHKYFLDRKVEGDFEISDMRKLGITATLQWNNQPEVLDEEEFKEKFNNYLKNFEVSEFPVRSFCWTDDLPHLEGWLISNKVEKPKTMEYLIETEYQFPKERTTRKHLLKEFKTSSVKDDMFEEIIKDSDILISIF